MLKNINELQQGSEILCKNFRQVCTR